MLGLGICGCMGKVSRSPNTEGKSLRVLPQTLYLYNALNSGELL